MKKIVLTLSLLVAGIGAAYSQTTLWKSYNANGDTVFGSRYLCAVDSNTVWQLPYDGTVPTRACNIVVKTGNGSIFTRSTFLPDTNTFNSSNITALDSMTAYIALWAKAAGTAAGNTTGISGRIIKTVDGGATWTLASDTVNMFKGTKNFPDFVHFWDHNNGLALGDPNGNVAGTGTAEYEIWRTHNGGTTWTRVADANIPNPASGDAGLTNSYTTFGKYIWFGTEKGHVYTSSDSGNTWHVNTGTIGLAGGVQGLAFRDTLHGLAWGLAATTSTSNSLKKTSNGGTTWSAVSLTTGSNATNIGLNYFSAIPGTAHSFMSVGLNSGQTGFVTSVTQNDGTSWNILETGTTNNFLMEDVQMIDSTHGWAGNFSDNNLPYGRGGINKFKTSCLMYASATQYSFCPGDSSTLTATGAATYTWTAPSTNSSSVTVHPTTTAIYTVTGTSSTGCVDVETVRIVVATPPTLTFSDAFGHALLGSDTICVGGTSYINAAGADSYAWAPTTGLNVALGPVVFTNPTSTITYSITSDNGNCTGVSTFTVVVNPTDGATLTVTSPSLCVTTPSVQIVASGATSYSWTPSTGLSATNTASVTATTSVSTSYIVVGTNVTGTTTCRSSIESDVTVNTCLGIANISNLSNISVYPNPTNGVLNISMPVVNEGTTLYVTDMIGNQVFKSAVKDTNVSLDLSNLQKGLYMLTISNGQEKHIQKVVVQ